ncbi:MAG: DUF1579 family protein [Candidatus Acidiferrales bacterium]
MKTRWVGTLFLPIVAIAILVSGPSAAQSPPEWRDTLIDHMAGTWKLEGQVMGRDAHHDVKAEWVLHHQFLRIHEKTSADAPKSEEAYEAIWFLGYDPVSERYLLHLMDVFGARFSETLGYGGRDGNELHFVFEYPDGPFHTTYRWNPEKNTWEWLMEQKDKNDKWARFADLKLTKVTTP